MPSGENKFYVDNEKSHEYYSKFIGEELVDVTRRLFPLSKQKQDTFIAGLSMGGYGAKMCIRDREKTLWQKYNVMSFHIH